MQFSELPDRIRHGLRDYRLYAHESQIIGRRARLEEMGRNVAIGIGRMTFRGRPVQFNYRGFMIPLDLAEMTGGSDDTWEDIAVAHLDYYARWAPVTEQSSVLEIGCGIGRDAIHLIEVIGKQGRYLGVDVTRPSINWCRRNISRVRSNFTFEHLDVCSEMYNPRGRLSNHEVRLPAADASFDRVYLHSVFTHMFPAEVSHYLSEIARVLRSDGGLVLASFFIVDDEVLSSARATGAAQTFGFDGPEGSRINDPAHAEAAVAYTLEMVEIMSAAAGLRVRDIHRGFWSGGTVAPNGQDIIVLSHV